MQEFSMADRIGIIILNYNNAADTIHCIESIQQCDDAALHSILVIDNCSTDGSYETIVSHFSEKVIEVSKGKHTRLAGIPSVNIVRSGENKGYSSGNNIGLRIALQDETISYFWVLNNDTELKQDCIVKVQQYLHVKEPDEGITATLLALFDNRNLLQVLGAKYHPAFGMSTPYYIDHNLNEINESVIKAALPKMNYLIGASLVFSRKILEDVGLFNESFFLYGEELDYITRAKRKGWRFGIVPEAVVYHKVGATTKGGKNLNRKRPLFMEYHQSRSKLIYTKTFYPIYYPLVFSMQVGNLLRLYSFNLKIVYPIIKKLIKV